MEHEPGGPPQRPHVGDESAADEPEDLPDELTAAKTLSARAVLVDPHSGHFTAASPLIVRTSCSNFELHDLQEYS